MHYFTVDSSAVYFTTPRAGTRAFFGDTFDVEQSFKDFFAFDDNFPAFTIGVPDVLLRKSVKARQRMNDLLVHLYALVKPARRVLMAGGTHDTQRGAHKGRTRRPAS
jgi:hypothetical protein